jgi:hypothetical protein
LGLGDHGGRLPAHRGQGYGFASPPEAGTLVPMALIDVAGFVSDLKNHAADHGFHVHDERHFVETYSMRQSFEVDLHPEEACGGPLEFHLSVDVEPRAMLAFEDALLPLPEGEEPEESFEIPLTFTWSLPPVPNGPDLLLLATELAGLGCTWARRCSATCWSVASR